jgi:hypothetical protein
MNSRGVPKYRLITKRRRSIIVDKVWAQMRWTNCPGEPGIWEEER